MPFEMMIMPAARQLDCWPGRSADKVTMPIVECSVRIVPVHMLNAAGSRFGYPNIAMIVPDIE